MLTVTSNYALRAVVYLAQHADNQPIPGKTIAAEAGIPAPYLSRIMGDLVRAGVLDSSRGAGGGFRLSRPPTKILLFEAVTLNHGAHGPV